MKQPQFHSHLARECAATCPFCVRDLGSGLYSYDHQFYVTAECLSGDKVVSRPDLVASGTLLWNVKRLKKDGYQPVAVAHKPVRSHVGPVSDFEHVNGAKYATVKASVQEVAA